MLRISARVTQRAERRLRTNRWLGLILGLAGPAVILFAELDPQTPGFDPFAISRHVLVAIEMLLLTAWLIRPTKSPWVAACFVGAFGVGIGWGAFNVMKLIGLGFGRLPSAVGISGLITIGLGYLLFRLASDAWEAARFDEAPRRRLAITLGFLLAAGIPVSTEAAEARVVRSAMRELHSEDPRAIDTAQRMLAPLPWLDDDLLVQYAADESDGARRARIEELYLRRTGITMEQRSKQRDD
ncbi:MAG TPA: hypothetical protein VK843_13410 [Planctomycetota bacterium]|nr:hypothetical protein [Planctomycetota bacterium]